jgi:hypothetical protein
MAKNILCVLKWLFSYYDHHNNNNDNSLGLLIGATR